MHLSQSILGKHAVESITSRAKAALLVIGSDTFTRSDLSKTVCFNFLAAGNLSRLIAGLHIKSTRDLFYRIHPTQLALHGLGSISLATLGAAFELKKIGTLEDWVTHHTKSAEFVTFSTMKAKSLDTDAVAAEKKAIKTRKHGRNAAAASIRTRRFIDRRSAAQRVPQQKSA